MFTQVERAGPAPSTACSSSNFTNNRVLVFTATSACSAKTQGDNLIGNNLRAGGFSEDEMKQQQLCFAIKSGVHTATPDCLAKAQGNSLIGNTVCVLLGGH